MVKGNNILPNNHFHKWWQRYVKTWFNQAGRKKTRRLARQDKVAKNGTRPLGSLRPAVHPPTQKYNLKLRYGRGFTLEELKAAGLSKKVARTIGVSVDHRRKNRCMESLTMNADRLKDYMNRVVVFPRKGRKARKGFGGMPNDTVLSDVQGKLIGPGARIQTLFPLLTLKTTGVEFRAITESERQSNAFETLKNARKPPKAEE